IILYFFFQAEDGIRYPLVTGVQTCALPIFRRVKITLKETPTAKLDYRQGYYAGKTFNKFTAADKERQLEDALMLGDPITDLTIRSEERRVGKECKSQRTMEA